MNARLLGLFSGFPDRQFPADIAARLEEALPVRDRLVFISAWPADFDRNDQDSAGMHAMFTQYGMGFERFTVIDERTESAQAEQLIRTADCLFLMGGNPTLQHKLICDKGITEAIRRCSAVILGVSAGSINMAVHALDVWESPVPYAGLGLADITVKAHITPDSELIPTLRQISREYALPICAMEDGSAIWVQDGQVTSTGQIRFICNGEVLPFSAEPLCPSKKPSQV